MANTLSVYDPLFYAQEALIQVEKALGMANAVYRGYEKDSQSPGSIISIRKPSTFTAQDAPSAAQDITAAEVQITLDQWKEVKISLTDKELSYTGDRIIKEHIRPAAYALANKIDTSLCALYKDVPWYTDVASTASSTDIVAAHKVLFDNAVPQDGNWKFMIDSDMQANFLADAAFSQYQGAGAAGVDTQMRGYLGQKYGFDIFANQNVQSHTKGTASTATLAANGAASVGASTVALDAGSVTGTLLAGDSFVFAGHSQRYVVTATATASGNAFASVSIFPKLVAAVADNEVVTVSLDDHSANLAFHPNAFALAMAPLSTMGNELGAKIATVNDPVTGLSIRSRVYYVGDSSAVKVALDVLYGVKTLDPNLAVRVRN